MKTQSSLIVVLCSFAFIANAKTWQVGPTRQYTMPSQVMSRVGNGDTVEIDSGLYVKDVGVWNADSLVLRCSSGYAHLDAQDTAAQRKGIWVINGQHTYVEGIEFSGCAIDSADGQNGAGIRLQSNSPGFYFECRRCYFHDNQEGILTGNDTTAVFLIEACEFDHNGVETGANAGYQHNIYIGHSRQATIKFCYFHRSIIGHEIKTRSSTNYILYNKIVDGPDGDGSRDIDIPNGGLAYVIGNSIEKGPKTVNSNVIEYGLEEIINPDSEFYFVNNTVVTNRHSSPLQPYDTTIFFIFEKGSKVEIINNIFAGGTHLFDGSWDTSHNVISSDTAFFHFRNVLSYDYHPVSDFSGLYTAENFGTASNNPWTLNAISEYVHPLDSVSRIYEQEIGAFNEIGISQGVVSSVVGSRKCNFPNPFDRTTTIDVGRDGQGKVTLTVSDVLGNVVSRSVESIVDGHIIFERGNLASGVYRYTITGKNGNGAASGSLVVQ